MPTEQTLAVAKNKIWTDIKVEMDKQGYTTTSLAKFLNVNRPTVSFAIHGGTTPRDVEIRKNLSHFRNEVTEMNIRDAAIQAHKESKKAPQKNAVLTVEDGFVTINGIKTCIKPNGCIIAKGN